MFNKMSKTKEDVLKEELEKARRENDSLRSKNENLGKKFDKLNAMYTRINEMYVDQDNAFITLLGQKDQRIEELELSRKQLAAFMLRYVGGTVATPVLADALDKHDLLVAADAVDWLVDRLDYEDYGLTLQIEAVADRLRREAKGEQ